MTINEAHLVALRNTVTLTYIPVMTPGLYDRFPWPPETFPGHIRWIPVPFRGGKRCERCERCSCKDFPTGVKILVKNVIKGGEKMFSPKLYLKNVIKGGLKTAGNQKYL